MKAWHFLYDDGKLRRKVNGFTYPKVGQTLTVDPDKLDLCNYGLHASKRLIDALQYAPGAVICRVEVTGKMLQQEDKLVASERTILAMADATTLLHEFACWAARRALANVANPDPRSLAAIEAKEAWLRGEISDFDLSQAANAAAAARAGAANAAAWAAARAGAANAAAWAAAWAAADAAAWAAWAAADAANAAGAAGAAEKESQNKELTRRVNRLLRSTQQ